MTSSTIVTPHDHHTTPLHHHGRNLNLHNVVDMPKNIKPLVCITPLMLMCGDFPGKWVVLHSSHVKYVCSYYCQFRTCNVDLRFIVKCILYSLKTISGFLYCHVTMIITNQSYMYI